MAIFGQKMTIFFVFLEMLGKVAFLGNLRDLALIRTGVAESIFEEILNFGGMVAALGPIWQSFLGYLEVFTILKS